MKVYLISGKARHGKDTLGKYLKKYYELRGKKCCIMHFSSYLKHYAEEYFGWDKEKEEKPRELLQKLGQEIIREDLQKPYFLIDRITEDIEILSHFFDVFLITDVRLPLEIEIVKQRFANAVSIHINRFNFETKELNESERSHLTETALDDYQNFDYKIENTTLENLEKDAENVVRKEEFNDEKDDKYRN